MSRIYRGCRLRDVFGRVAAHRVWVECTVGRWDAPRQYSRELKPEAAHLWAWGGEQPGSMLLAAYLLLDAVGDWERAAPHFYRFMQEFVCQWPERWAIREASICEWLLDREKQAEADEATQRLFVAAGIREENNGGQEDEG